MALSTVSMACSLTIASTRAGEFEDLPDCIFEGALRTWRQVFEFGNFGDVGTNGSRAQK